jgi:hypothetical protein
MKLVSRVNVIVLPALVAGLSGCAPLTLPNTPPVKSLKATPSPKAVQYRLYIPTVVGGLQLRVEENPNLLLTHEVLSGHGYDWSVQAATEAVNRLLKAAPKAFPPGTKIVRGVYDNGGYPTISFNRAFSDERWWNNSSRGRIALAAIVNTSIETKVTIWTTSDDDSLTIYVDNKPVKTLGAFDLSKPIEWKASSLHK